MTDTEVLDFIEDHPHWQIIRHVSLGCWGVYDGPSSDSHTETVSRAVTLREAVLLAKHRPYQVKLHALQCTNVTPV